MTPTVSPATKSWIKAVCHGYPLSQAYMGKTVPIQSLNDLSSMPAKQEHMIRVQTLFSDDCGEVASLPDRRPEGTA